MLLVFERTSAAVRSLVAFSLLDMLPPSYVVRCLMSEARVWQALKRGFLPPRPARAVKGFSALSATGCTTSPSDGIVGTLAHAVGNSIQPHMLGQHAVGWDGDQHTGCCRCAAAAALITRRNFLAGLLRSVIQ